MFTQDTRLAARDHIKSAERKIAQGIQVILGYVKTLELSYDPQGIAYYDLSKAELDALGIADQFPNRGKDGFSVFLYKEGFIPHSPLNYMLKQKITSLFQGAKIYFAKRNLNIDLDKLEEELLLEASKKVQALSDIQNAEQFHEKAKVLMEQLTGNALVKLHAQNPVGKRPKFEEFCKKVINFSSHHRSNKANILTVNEATGQFSYDEPITVVTAHDRSMGQGVANYSMVFEGHIASSNQQAEVTSYVFKHASLAAIDEMGKLTTLLDGNQSDIDMLIDTCNRIEGVVKGMAMLRQHGGASTKLLDINWTYQLLTSNFINLDKQATSYGYIAKASHLMDGAYLDLPNGTTVNLHMNVFNAGINSRGKHNFGFKNDLQRRENRKAYLDLTQAAQIHLSSLNTFDEDIFTRNSNLQFLSSDLIRYFRDDTTKELIDEFNNLKNEISDNSSRFNLARKAYNEIKKEYFKEYSKENPDTTKLETLKNTFDTQTALIKGYLDKGEKLNDQLRHITYKIEEEHKVKWENNRFQLNKVVANVFNPVVTATFKQDLNHPNEAKRQVAEDRIIAMAAMVYKIYMDELYYSGDYRQPNKAIIFNGYMAAYQQLTGLEVSSGCKSANDRTWRLRVALAVLEDRDVVFPKAFHKDKQQLKEFANCMKKQGSFSSATISAIDDTGGAPPKVKFHFLEAFGHYAAHKMKHLIDKFKIIYNKTLSSSASSLFTLFGRDKSTQQAGRRPNKEVPAIQSQTVVISSAPSSSRHKK